MNQTDPALAAAAPPAIPLAVSPCISSGVGSGAPAQPGPQDSTSLVEHVRRTARFLLRSNLRSQSALVGDLCSAGLVALVEASHRFDPGRGADLWQFARQRVRGAMLDELRRHRRGGGFGTHASGMAVELDGEQLGLDAVGEVIDPSPSAEEDLCEREQAARLAAAERRLPHRLRQVLHLRTRQGWSVQRIAEHFGISPGRVCQLITQGTDRLRRELHVREAA